MTTTLQESTQTAAHAGVGQSGLTAAAGCGVDNAALLARGLSVGYDGHQVIENLDVAIPAGKITTIIGPNGSGKSTLLKALAGIIPHTSGEVRIQGTALQQLSAKKTAQTIAFLPQQPSAPEGMLGADLVALGRHPHRSWLRQFSAEDQRIVHKVMEQTQTTEFADRPVNECSGGQQQRLWIAMALAQSTPIVLLDEPTTYLDLAHSVSVLKLVRQLHADEGTTVCMVLHDITLALRVSDHLIVVDDGAVVAAGAPADIMTEELLRDVFDLDAHLLPDPHHPMPVIAPVC